MVRIRIPGRHSLTHDPLLVATSPCRAQTAASSTILPAAAGLQQPGLPLMTVPGSKLESGRGRPAFGLTEGERRADPALAARSPLALVADI